MTTNQVLLGVGLILVLAVGCQILGRRLRIPALILLLPAGFVAGWLTDDVNPNRLLGASFQPLVSLSVAVILYDAGLGLDLSKLRGHTRHVVIRLLAIGVPVTAVAAAFVAEPLFGMSHGAAAMLGAILVVSGPTVVGPLLAVVRPSDRLRRVLIWEGSLIDPIGALLGAVVFHAVSTNAHEVFGYKVGRFLLSMVIGVAGGVIGVLVLWLLLTKLRLGEGLGTSAQMAVVVGLAAACDMLRDDTGLIAAIVMGLALANMKAFDMPARRPFFEILVQLVIGVLFISISATVTPASLQHLLLPTLALVGVLVLVIRPLVAAASTLRTDLSAGERAFVGWMAPRGIVAAATASTFSVDLVAQHVGGASKILPVTFLTIVATVVLYGLSAGPVAKWLGVKVPEGTRPLIVGGQPWVVALGSALRDAGLSVLMWAESDQHRSGIASVGLELAPDDLIADATTRGQEIEGITAIMLLTPEDGFNAIAATLLSGSGEGGEIYRVGSAGDARGTAAVYAGGDVLFGSHLTGAAVERRFNAGERFAVDTAGGEIPSGHDLLFRVRANGLLAAATLREVPLPMPGDVLVLLGPERAPAND